MVQTDERDIREAGRDPAEAHADVLGKVALEY